MVKKVVCDTDTKGPGGEAVQIGSFTSELLAGTMSEIPTNEDWTDMEESGLASVLKRVAGHLGHVSFSFIFLVLFNTFFGFLIIDLGSFQLGGLFSGAVDIAYNDLKAVKSKKRKTDTQIAELNTKLTELKSTHAEQESELKSDLQAARTQDDEAEKESGDLKREVEEQKKKLSDRKDEATIIVEFKMSPEYDEAIANVGAPEIQRCWLIAERHIKTDPYASWASFVNEFIATKISIEELPSSGYYRGPDQ